MAFLSTGILIHIYLRSYSISLENHRPCNFQSALLGQLRDAAFMHDCLCELSCLWSAEHPVSYARLFVVSGSSLQTAFTELLMPCYISKPEMSSSVSRLEGPDRTNQCAANTGCRRVTWAAYRAVHSALVTPGVGDDIVIKVENMYCLCQRSVNKTKDELTVVNFGLSLGKRT